LGSWTMTEVRRLPVRERKYWAAWYKARADRSRNQA
jgi:hypothetical protein